ncbi:MAG: peptidase M20 [Anaerolineaceae bacterium]|nr:peptidase M20 [Anaerolineaceae bacterium]
MLSKARLLQKQMSEWRREIHSHPELSFAEFRTAETITSIMKKMGYRVRTGVGKTGVVAELGEGKPVVAIRADMDALPIKEANKVPYKSKNKGVMHACGHDVHVAIALGTAKLLKDEQFTGTIRFLFQPAEEAEDEEGFSGAQRMIQDGAIQDVDYALALHTNASLPTGQIEIATDFASAGADTFYAKIIGKGGHGSTPHKVVDPIFISGHIILALHGIVSRRLRPFDSAVISIGSIHGGQVDNVIPEFVDLSGTIRFLNPEVQEHIHTEIQNIMEITKAMGGDYELILQKGYPPMHNNEEIVALLNDVAGNIVGKQNVSVPDVEMGAEDFGYFLEKSKGAMFMLGCEIEGDTRRHHDPKFDVDENCMPIGAAIFAQAALRMLNHKEA